MADSHIQLSPDSTGKKLDTEELTVSGQSVHRERIQVAGDSDTDIAPVTAADGLLVNLGANNDVSLGAALPAGTNNIGDVDVASLPNEGQQTMAGSISVAVASDQSAVPVSGTVAVTGVATLAEQQTQTTHLSQIEAAVETLDNAISGSEMQVDIVSMPAVDTELTTADLDTGAGTDTRAVVGLVRAESGGGTLVGSANPLPVSAASLPLPTGAATLAEQQTQTTHLATIAGDTTAIETAVQIMDDWDESDRAKVNPIVGQAGVAAGAGAVGATVQRVTLASDDPAVASLQTLDNAISGSEMQVDVVAALPAGTNNIGDVDVLSVIPGTGATNLGKAVDGTAGGTDSGVAALVVRDDALAALTPVDGDYTTLRVDSTGALWTRSTSAAGGTSATDEDAFTPTSSTGTPVMGARDDTSPDTLAEGVLGIIRATENRALHVNLRDAAGAELAVGGGTQYTEDAAAAANPVGTALNLIRADTLAGVTSTDGDNVAARGTDKGELYVKHVDAVPVTDNSGSLTVDNAGTFAVQATIAAAATSIAKAEDAAHSDGDVGAMVLAVRDDTLNIRSGAENDYEPLHTDANGALWTQDVNSAAALTSLQTLDNAVSGSEFQVDVVAALPAGTNNIGDVDILSIAAGDNNIGNVDLASAIPAGTNNIGDVDIASVAAGTSIEVVGDVAADVAVPANPVAVGGRASTAVPTAVSADGDSVYQWLNRNGLTVVSGIPGAGLNADPYTLLSETAQYTTTQTSTVLVAGGASERIVVTSIQIQAGGTTAGTLQVYFGTGAYSRGTDEAIFDGEFAPSATLKPGFFAAPPAGFRAGALGDDILVTTSAAINPLTVTVWYYILGV